MMCERSGAVKDSVDDAIFRAGLYYYSTSLDTVSN